MTFFRALGKVTCKLQATAPWLQACCVPTTLLRGTDAVRHLVLFFLVPDDSYSDSCKEEAGAGNLSGREMVGLKKIPPQ